MGNYGKKVDVDFTAVSLIMKGSRINHDKSNFTGLKFNRLTILNYIKQEHSNKLGYLCQCDCGNQSFATWVELTNSTKMSCGCLNAEVNKQFRKLEYGTASFNKLYTHYKSNSKNRGLVFDLSKSLFEKLTSQNCHYCGMEPSSISFSKGANGYYRYNGIDRLDNAIGYIESNCVPCCEMCNRMKLDYTLEEFENKIKQIFFNFISK